ncbi:hypothetical protein GR27_003118 [Salmonella enterica subsp. enterica]|nr:hypothetical protein [Salmonella enterica subsp. salamae]EDW1163285.1 hypothetical protein [Salmonella enterica subsp. enterica]HAK7992757.1 hypothetical protein [Salmonella enterica]
MPLPLREYYPIARAAELLECTIDDLLHWGATERIKICIKAHMLDAFFSIDNFEYSCREFIENYNLYSLNSEGTYDAIKLIEIIYNSFKECENDFFNDIKEHWIYPYFYQLFKGESPDLNSEIHSSSYCLKKRFDSELINDIYDRGNDLLEIPVYLYGFFVLPSDFYINAEDDSDEVATSSIKYEYEFVCTYDYLTMIRLDDVIEFNINHLFILKDDFIKVKEASKKGVELAKITCLSKQEQHRTEKENKNGYIKAVRNSVAARTVVKALIIKNYPDVKTNPVKIASILEAEIKSAGLGDFSISKDTVSRWMKED